MGWRLRKSINLGLGFKINLSKSGIGYSWGFPGYRTTKLVNGGTRQTYSLPGTGLSYVEQQGKRKNGSGENHPHYDKQSNLILGETEVFNNVPIDDIAKNDPILKEINKVLWMNRISNILLIIGFLIILHPAFILSLIAGIIIKMIIAFSKKIKLYYEFDDENRKMYNALKEIWIALSRSRKMWQINSSVDVYNRKYNAGAGHNITRSRAYITNKTPSFIKTNIDIYGLNLQNQKLFFTPDRILVFKPFRKAFGCTYRDLFIGLVSSNMIEHEGVPQDAEIVDYTWRYTNVDGSRDLRFSNNKQFPVCRYGELTLKSPNGIYTVLHFSNHDMAEDIQSKIILFGNQFNKILELTEKKNNPKSPTKEKVIEKNTPKKKIHNLDSIVEEGLKVDPEFDKILDFVLQSDKASASLIQRKFKLGYNRAALVTDFLEENGIIGPFNGSSPREVLVTKDEDGE